MVKVDNKLVSIMRRAINDFSMIKDGDHVAVGLSGGKDSMVLAAALACYQIFSPQKFTLTAITVDLGFKGADFSLIAEFCARAGIAYHVEKTDIAEIIFEKRKEPNPCSLCSKMRRGTLNSVLLKMGCNKLALGHHGDDLVETLLLSLFYEGRLSTFAPVSFMDRTGVTLIRPFIYAEEKNIAAAARNLPVMHNPCPANHHTRREYVKTLIADLGAEIPGVKERMLSAITHPDRNNLWDKLTNHPHTSNQDQLDIQDNQENQADPHH